MKLKLAEQVAVVTGASSGIGRAIATLFAAEGARVIAADADRDGGRHAAEAITQAGGKCWAHQTDVSAAEQVQELADTVIQREGRLDILVNCAGIGVRASVVETSDADWDRVLGVDLKGPFLMCRAAIPHMMRQGGGVIINVSSAGGLVGLKDRAAYCAAKAGLIGLTRAMAVDHTAQGIRVNSLCPGTIDSPWIRKILAGADDPGTLRKTMESRQLTGRMGTPEEIAHAALFLAQPESAFVVGTCLSIDGGMTAY